MKLAVSVPDPLFERAEHAAARLGLNRSQLYVRALEAFLSAEGDDPVTARLDALSPEHADAEGGAVAGRSLVDLGVWEW